MNVTRYSPKSRNSLRHQERRRKRSKQKRKEKGAGVFGIVYSYALPHTKTQIKRGAPDIVTPTLGKGG